MNEGREGGKREKEKIEEQRKEKGKIRERKKERKSESLQHGVR